MHISCFDDQGRVKKKGAHPNFPQRVILKFETRQKVVLSAVGSLFREDAEPSSLLTARVQIFSVDQGT